MNYINRNLIGIISVSLVALLVSTFSCSDNNSKTVDKAAEIILEVNSSKAKTLNIKEVTDSVKFILLETNDNSLISEISKLYISDNEIIVFDRERKNILLFDKNGMFIRKIGKIGNGPSEYLYLNDVYYDEINKKIYAFARMKKKMFVYSLDGSISEIINSSFSFNSFIKAEKGFWLYSGGFKDNSPDNFNLILANEQLNKIEKGFFPQSGFIMGNLNERFSEDNKHNKYFYYPNSNTIYKLAHSNVKPFIEIDYKDKNIPYNEFNQVENVEEYDKILNRKVHLGFIENLHFTKNMCSLNFSEIGSKGRGITYTAHINLQDRELNIYNGFEVIRGELNSAFSNLLCTTAKNELIYEINPNTLPNFEFKDLKHLIPSVSEDSNPILVFYKLRN